MSEEVVDVVVVGKDEQMGKEQLGDKDNEVWVEWEENNEAEAWKVVGSTRSLADSLPHQAVGGSGASLGCAGTLKLQGYQHQHNKCRNLSNKV